MRLSLVTLLAMTAIGGCQCHLVDGLDQIPDAGHDKPDAGPPPPKFPLKAGDSVKYPALQGRTADNCAGHTTTGDCQLAVLAQYDITGVTLDPASNTFTVTANVAYLLQDNHKIDDAAMKPLVLEKAAPFADALQNQSVTASGTTFVTGTAETDQMNPSAFPFFQFNAAAPDIFEAAGHAFCDRYTQLDAQANCKFQAAANQMIVFYKDTQAGGNAELHKLEVDYLPVGIIVNWDELLIPFIDDTTTPRDDTAFHNVGIPDLAGSFAFSPTITRDGVDYLCNAFNKKCIDSASNTHLCTDPDEAPSTSCQ